jgi:alkylation response protein AidB-like acyl-CoA dehydrogenase
MDMTLNSKQLAFQKFVLEFAIREIIPYQTLLQEDLVFRKGLYQKMAQQGLFFPSQDALSHALAIIEISKVNAGVGVALSVTHMVAETIQRLASEEQRAFFLPGFKSGTSVPAAFALTEKMAGSDPKNMQTHAKLEGEEIVIEGEKQFITNGNLAQVLIVMAKTSFSDQTEKISALILDGRTPGLEVIKIEKKLGLQTVDLVTLKLNRCRIPKSRLLGKEGAGLKIALQALDSGRIGIAAQSIGIAQAAYEAAIKFAHEREQFGHPIDQNQAIAFKLADMSVSLEAAKLLLYKACWLKDQGQPFTLEASQAKLFCSEMCNQVTYEALQIHGGYGYIQDYPLERYFRDARATTLYEGTSEIQRIVISRHLINSASDCKQDKQDQ